MYNDRFGGAKFLQTAVHALKNTANQRTGLSLHILRYATGSMRWVVLHSTFPSLLTRNSLLAVHLRTSQNPVLKLFNSCEQLRTIPIMSGKFSIISEHFRRFSGNFKKIIKISKNCFLFPKFSENFTFKDFPSFSENFKKP